MKIFNAIFPLTPALSLGERENILRRRGCPTPKKVLTCLFGALMLLAAMLSPRPAMAQRSFDLFQVPRTVVLGAPFNLGPASNTVTNSPVDIRILDGIGRIDIITTTNTGTAGGTLTVQFYTSPDTTNWVTLANYAMITNTTQIIYTNNYYGTLSPKATNNWLLPYTITTPIAASAGWVTKYPLPLQFTNSGAINVATAGAYTVGFNTGDAGRYIQAVWTTGGAATNFTAAILVSGMTHDTTLW